MISGKPRVLGGHVALGLALVIAGLAFDGRAQDQPESAEPVEIDRTGPERDAPSRVDEITVTGEKSSATDVQAESQAITAFSMDQLDRSNIVNVDQLAFNVPALHVGQQGADSIITLRGISTENASPTGEAGVQFVVDGVNYARPSAARVAFFDLEGLQVIRGPQGTRGGKNATAGWIEVTTRKPTSDFQVSSDYQVGSYGQTKTRAAINIPINERREFGGASTRCTTRRRPRSESQAGLRPQSRDGTFESCPDTTSKPRAAPSAGLQRPDSPYSGPGPGKAASGVPRRRPGRSDRRARARRLPHESLG